MPSTSAARPADVTATQPPAARRPANVRTPRRGRGRLGFHRRDQVLGLLLFLPVLVWILAVLVYPLIYSVILSLRDARFSTMGARWIGAKNYIRVLGDPEFWRSAMNTLVWTLGNYVVQMGAGFGVALLLNQRFRGAALLRTWIVVPWVIPTVAMTIMWIWMLNASVGVINHLLLAVGLLSERVSLLGTPSTAMPTVVLLNSWRLFPLVTVVILAAMQTVPEELYEAAVVDGAPAWGRFRHVLLPWIRPTLSVLSLLLIIWVFNSFVIIWLTTQGGPGNTTLILPVLVYKTAFAIFRLSEGATISVLMFVALLVVAVAYLRFQRTEESR